MLSTRCCGSALFEYRPFALDTPFTNSRCPKSLLHTFEQVRPVHSTRHFRPLHPLLRCCTPQSSLRPRSPLGGGGWPYHPWRRHVALSQHWRTSGFWILEQTQNENKSAPGHALSHGTPSSIGGLLAHPKSKQGSGVEGGDKAPLDAAAFAVPRPKTETRLLPAGRSLSQGI